MTPRTALTTPPVSGRLVHLTEAAWPVLAGTLTALGVVGAARMYGVVGLVLIFVASALFTMVMVYGTLAESGIVGVRVARIGVVAALVLVVLLGLVHVFPVFGWLLAAGGALTSPLVTDRLSRRRPPEAPDAAARTARLTAPDQLLVDRIFEQLVSDLETDGSSGREGARPRSRFSRRRTRGLRCAPRGCRRAGRPRAR
jgi:hypothetical protein